MYELGLIGRRHDDEAGERGKIGNIECPRMRRAIGADEPRAVHGKPHRQGLDGHVMDHLVVGALKEGRVDHGKGPEPFGREPRCEGDAVLLGDADIETAVWELFGEKIEPGA